MFLLRRLVPQLGFLTMAGLAWNHRGTLVRLVDLATDAPRLVREDGASGLARQGRKVFDLDRTAPTDMSVRIRETDEPVIDVYATVAPTS